MKQSIFIFCSLTLLTLISCGPAAEDREAMYARAKVFQDSIANTIKMALDEAKIDPKSTPAPIDSASLKAIQNPTAVSGNGMNPGH